MSDVNFQSMLEAVKGYFPRKDPKFNSIKADVLFLYCKVHKSFIENGSVEGFLQTIQSILDITWEELNTGHWTEVSVEERKLFSYASLLKVIGLIERHCKSSDLEPCDTLSEAIRTADLGLLLGSELNKELSNAATIMTSALYIGKTFDGKIKCFDNDSKADWDFQGVKGSFVPNSCRPSLECFHRDFFSIKQPAKLTECIKHWPALEKWKDLNYLLRLAGPRTVPVEVGSSYTQSDWGMKLSTLHDFIFKYIIQENTDVGYLAQHQLFNQIPELKNDIRVPEYCCLSELGDDYSEADINAWFGPAGTVSPLHYDPKHNLLTQVIGRKRVILYSPEDSKYLYPHEEQMLHNSAQVDPYEPDYDKYPEFKSATPFECWLYPGDMLYIPPKWWHHVRALDISFSVSFWWQ